VLGEETTTCRDLNGKSGRLGVFLLQEVVKLNGVRLPKRANEDFLFREAGALVPETLSEELAGTLFPFNFFIWNDPVFPLTAG
jgi:hypothetical protein